MKGWFLGLNLLLAYGPFALLLLLYLAGWLLRRSGRPGLVEMLVRRTEIPPTVSRMMKDRDEDTGATAHS